MMFFILGSGNNYYKAGVGYWQRELVAEWIKHKLFGEKKDGN